MFYCVENVINMILMGKELFAVRDVPQPSEGRGLARARKLSRLSTLRDNTFLPTTSALRHMTAGYDTTMYSLFKVHRAHHLQFARRLVGLLHAVDATGENEQACQARFKELVVAFVQRADIDALDAGQLLAMKEKYQEASSSDEDAKSPDRDNENQASGSGDSTSQDKQMASDRGSGIGIGGDSSSQAGDKQMASASGSDGDGEYKPSDEEMEDEEEEAAKPKRGPRPKRPQTKKGQETKPRKPPKDH